MKNQQLRKYIESLIHVSPIVSSELYARHKDTEKMNTSDMQSMVHTELDAIIEALEKRLAKAKEMQKDVYGLSPSRYFAKY